MAFWLASAREGQDSEWIQRFDPRFWTVDFPRPMLAAVTAPAADRLRIDTLFQTRGDLAGVNWESEDRFDHCLLAYATDRDYTGTQLTFHWRSQGVIPLDAVNGPTLTVSGKDAGGSSATWYVRLWNYATGTPQDARIAIDFDDLRDGWFHNTGNRVSPDTIDRLSISLVPPGFAYGSAEPLASPLAGWVELSEIRCTGARCLIEAGDVVMPANGLGCATAYDDATNLVPARLLRNLRGLGYHGSVLHYVGMSHYFPLVAAAGGSHLVDAAGPALAGPAEAWLTAFLADCRDAGLSPILSLSFELLARHCPDDWQQRRLDGSPARTGWEPPSALMSPASGPAMDWLRKVAGALARLMAAAGLPVRIQIGEPWWWTDDQRRIHLYDQAARAAFGGSPPAIADLGQPLDAAQTDLLDRAGALLASATISIRDAVRQAVAPSPAEVLLLAFLPTVLDPATPEARRANLPTGWVSPAFDRLQIEDYDWLTAGQDARRQTAYAQVVARLHYPLPSQDYLAGFVPQGFDRLTWRLIDPGIDEACLRQHHEIFVWAQPQICRDGYVRLPSPPENATMQAFDDLPYPLALGRDATVTPEFSTAVSVTASGFERRNSLWADARLRFDVGPGIRSEAELGELLVFFRARRGAARGFRLRDPCDFSSAGLTGLPLATDQLLGTGDGVSTRFALVKRYGEGEEAQIRRITRPVEGSVLVSIDGVERAGGWTLGEGGLIVFTEAPAAQAEVRAGFLFDVPVRFAEDSMAFSGHAFASGEVPSVPLVEIREAS